MTCREGKPARNNNLGVLMQQFVIRLCGFSREFHARKCTVVHLKGGPTAAPAAGIDPAQVTFTSFRAGSSGG